MSLKDFKRPKGNSPLDRTLKAIYDHLNGDTEKTIATTTYTIKESDAGKFLYFTNASGCTVTLPASFKRPVEIMGVNKSTGTITFTAGAGATLEATGTSLSTQYSACTIKHEGTYTWGVYGLS